MAAQLGILRGMAKAAGIPASVIRSATSANELQKLITEAMNGGAPAKPARKPAAKKPVRKTATPTRAAKKSPANKPVPAVKSPVGKAKRPAAVNGDEAGRRLLVGVDYTQDEGWQPREGSPPDLIVKSLRKHKGNREKVFQALVSNIATFVGAKKQDGNRRTKTEREDMLRYRISRTAWDFAMKTGQHEKSENRAQYGSGGTPAKTPAKKAPVRKATPARKPVARKPVKKATTPARPAKKKRTTARR
jgi:hypothetical protein